jgi:hypothetical protein
MAVAQVSEPKKAADDSGRHDEEQKMQENAVRALVDLYEVVMRDFLADMELRSDLKNA